jgi:integrase
VRRAELHTAGQTRGRPRVHDLRGTRVTLNLAAGKSETSLADRTGHTSSVMINGYRRTIPPWWPLPDSNRDSIAGEGF